MNFSFELKPLFLSGLAVLLLLFPGQACAQADNSQGQPGQEKPAEKKDDPADTSARGPHEQEQNQSVPEITAVPNRPTFSTTAEAVQRGVLEVEYGAELADGHQNINGLIKFGIFKNLELRFANNPFVRDGGVSGLGDSGAGFKYRVLPQQGLRPTFSVLYTASISTSTSTPGIGATGHGLDILFSKDFGNHHFDFNEGVRLSGRPGAGGYDRNYFTAFDYAHPLPRKWGYALEIAGFSRSNAATPASMVILLAATYNVSSRLVLDGGEYTAVYGNFPRATVFVGVTYSIADLYRVRHTIPAASRSH